MRLLVQLLALGALGRESAGERVGIGFTMPATWTHDRVPFEFVVRRALGELQAAGRLPAQLAWDVLLDAGCGGGSALVSATDLYYKRNVSVIMGATCSSGTESLGLLAAEWNLPVVPNAAKSTFIADKARWSTTARIVESSEPIGPALAQWLIEMNWLQVGLMGNPLGASLLFSSLLEGLLPPIRIVHQAEFDHFAPFDEAKLDEALDVFRARTRVVIIAFGTPSTGRGVANAKAVLARAKERGMVGPDWVWIVPLGLDATMTPQQLQALPFLFQDPDPAALRQTFVHTATGRSDDVLLSFMDTLRNWTSAPDAAKYHPQVHTIFHPTANATWNDLKWHVMMVMLTHDAAQLYGLALERCFRADSRCDYRNGTLLMKHIKYLSFDGVTGPVQMTGSFDRAVSYTIYGLDPDNLKQTVYWTQTMKLKETSNETLLNRYTESERSFPWATESGQPPPDIPLCGLRNEKCPVDLVLEILLGTIILIAALSGGIFGVLRHKQAELEKEILARSWEFSLVQMRMMDNAVGASLKSLGSIRSIRSERTADKVNLEKGDRFGYVGKAKIGKRTVALKHYPTTEQLAFKKRSVLLALKQLTEVKHENVTRLLGLCLERKDRLLVAWEEASKGSLADVLHNEDVALDAVFKGSIVRDVLTGLHYIHNSPIRAHGALTTENCVVDGRWVVKLTDFGLPHALREHRQRNVVSFKNYSADKLLQTAPELLASWKAEVGIDAQPTKAADVYSFAMVLYQVLTRSHLFDDELVSEEELRERIVNGQMTDYRPPVPEKLPDDPEGELSVALLPLMRNCWQTDPEERPDTEEIRKIVLKLRSSDKNIVEHIMSVLEKYAGNLENMVAARTSQVAEERRRADELLARMLPVEVAEELKGGRLVPPESFHSVTVFFSDVAGFQAIAARSDPLQLVTLLNTLYGALDRIIQQYDVYKVETVGDSYMVASGLPKRNGSQHLLHIANMALVMRETVSMLRVPHLADQPLHLRIGIHTGPCAAGVVGSTMPRYCLFGDTVNTASRMETTSEAGRIQVSQAAKTLLDSTACGMFKLTFRGTVAVKGKGEMTTFWLERGDM